MTVPKRYAQEMSSELGYIPVWVPGKKIAIGDVITFERGEYEIQEQRLRDLGSVFFTQPGHMRHSSRGDVRAAVKVDSPPARLSVSFESEGAVLMDAHDCRVSHLEQFGSLTQVIRRDSDWNPRWFVVTEVLEARSLLLLFARKNGASIEVEVPSLDVPSLASPGVKIGAASQDGAVTTYQLPAGPDWFAVGFKAYRYTGDSWLRQLKFKQALAAGSSNSSSFNTFASAADLYASERGGD